MDWPRESNRQQCQQATPTGPDVPRPIFWGQKTIFIFCFFIDYFAIATFLVSVFSTWSVQTLLQCRSKFLGKSGFGVRVHLNASGVNWIALK